MSRHGCLINKNTRDALMRTGKTDHFDSICLCLAILGGEYVNRIVIVIVIAVGHCILLLS